MQSQCVLVLRKSLSGMMLRVDRVDPEFWDDASVQRPKDLEPSEEKLEIRIKAILFFLIMRQVSNRRIR